MTKEVDTTFQVVFSQISSTDSVKLLPWCISSAVPLHYMNEVLATAAQQREGAPATTLTLKKGGSQALAYSNSLAHQAETPPLPVLPCWTFHLVVLL